MAKPPDYNISIDRDLQDQIRPENRVSNISGRGSFTSCRVKSVKERRTAAAKKLLALREERALAEVKAKMKRKRMNDQLEFEQRKRQLEMEERKRKLELEQEEKKRHLEMEEKKQMIEEEKLRRQLEDEQLEMSLNAERRRLEAEKELLEAEEEDSIVSLARSKVSCKSRPRTSISIRRPALTSMSSI